MEKIFYGAVEGDLLGRVRSSVLSLFTHLDLHFYLRLIIYLSIITPSNLSSFVIP
jgi:hypothetical protein